MLGNMPPELDILHDNGFISHLDYYFAGTMADAFPKEGRAALLACALVSRALSRGHVCLDLKEAAGSVPDLPDTTGRPVRLPGFGEWVSALKSSGLVTEATDTADTYPAPLVLASGRLLFLAKYHDFTERLVKALAGRVRAGQQTVEKAFLHDAMEKAFKGQDPEKTAGQRTAVRTALQQRLTLISGGPGTGKTHVTTIIRQLLEQYAALKGMPAPRFVFMAPTGKAASRLDRGATLHSVLKPLGDRPGFVHGRETPILADVVIIDEASMIDLALMTRTLEAIPAGARVILLGDNNQLSPVQAGAVFQDICATPEMAPHRVFLTHNFRSGGKTGIETLSQAIVSNDADRVAQILGRGEYPDLVFADTTQIADKTGHLHALAAQGYRPLMQARDMASGLAAMDVFRILCAHNTGESGTLQVNHLCEKILRKSVDSDIRSGFFKRIIMIRTNDYHRGLFNGDTGVVLEDRALRVAGFNSDDNGIRQFRPADLPSFDPAFAVTIHKSQGSEFDTVLILIPDKISPVVTRQLLYTGVTRARKKAIIMGRPEVIREAMGLSPQKMSTVSDRLSLELNTPI